MEILQPIEDKIKESVVLRLCEGNPGRNSATEISITSTQLPNLLFSFRHIECLEKSRQRQRIDIVPSAAAKISQPTVVEPEVNSIDQVAPA